MWKTVARMQMGMAFVTMWIRVWVPWMRAASATVQERCTNADAATFLKEIAIAKATKQMLWAFVEEAANRTTTTMEFVTQTKKSWTLRCIAVPGPHGMQH